MFRKHLILGALVLTGSMALTLWAADAPKIDTSTPQGAFKAMYDLALAGDIPGIKKLFVTPTTDREKELLEYGLSDDVYGPGLSAALREKFPDANFPSADKAIQRAKESVDKMDVKIEGDKATLSMPATTQGARGGGPKPITMTKVGDEWKLPLEDGVLLRMPPEQSKPLYKARTTMMAQLTADVKAGKFATFEEARTAMQQRMQEVQKLHGATTGPTTRMTTQPR